ncbi:MAG: 4-(cytidine 5'-diphospho)-2-C-methyl-D-erythritol kinase, partial [Thermoleophilaceae bacterium]
MIRELAPAKVNLVLRVGPVAKNGLHEVCSLFASLVLADVIEVEESDEDRVVCAGVEGPNLAATALRAFRTGHKWLKGGPAPVAPLEVRIDKRIPVAGGLAGGSADAAAVLRCANELAGRPFGPHVLRALAANLGSDVPSQIEPGHAIVRGTGERVEPVALPEMALALVPAAQGLSTADVFAEADRLAIPRAQLGCGDLRDIAAMEAPAIAARLENDLQAAALSLRPELAHTLEAVGGLGAQV